MLNVGAEMDAAKLVLSLNLSSLSTTVESSSEELQ